MKQLIFAALIAFLPRTPLLPLTIVQRKLLRKSWPVPQKTASSRSEKDAAAK